MDALHTRQSDGEDDVGARGGGSGHAVPVFDVGGATLSFAFKVGIGVEDDDAPASPQALDSGVEGTPADCAPCLRMAQPEKELVPAVGDVEHEPAHFLDRRLTEAVRVDDLLYAGYDIPGVVQHRLFGMPGEVGEQHHAAVPDVVAQSLGERHGSCGRPCAAGTTHHGHARPPSGRHTG